MHNGYCKMDTTAERQRERDRKAQEYSRRCYEMHRNRVRRFGTLVQRMLVGSRLFFLWAFVLAVLLGAM